MTHIDLAHQTFSNAWYRVADLCCALRPSVVAHRQQFEDEIWMVLNDKLSNEWFRISWEAYQFLATLTPDRTVEETWYITLERHPEMTLSQEEVVQILSQLHLANMLTYDQASGSDSFFERFSDKSRRKRLTLLTSFLALKLPLLDPDRGLNSSLPLIRFMFGPIGIAIYFVLIIVGLLTLTQNFSALFDNAAGILAPENLFLLYIGFSVAKIIHELGHAALCKYFGGEVHVLGLMFLLFTPIPYVDASASWGFRNRAERLWVAMAGMLFELAFASIAIVVWAHTAPGTLNALAYNIVFTASISTLLFNSNPLLRFDGYHMLVDALNMPNLFNNSRSQLRYLVSRYVLRVPNAKPAAQTAREAWILPIYGVISLGYWLLLMVGIISFVANQYLDLGILMALILGVMIFVIPLFKFIRYLVADKALRHIRVRTMIIVISIVALAIALLSFVPAPSHVRVDGVIEVQTSRKLFSEVSGLVVQRAPENGIWVNSGETLLQMENPELDYMIRSAEAKLLQLEDQMRQAIANTQANTEPLSRQIDAVRGHIANLLRQQAALTISAPMTGVWTATDNLLHRGAWVARGSYLGILTQPGEWHFIGVLPQVDAYVFEQGVEHASLKIDGQEAITLAVRNTRIIPHDSGTLPSPVLGMAGGGSIAVDPTDPNGVTTTEPFFRIEAELVLIERSEREQVALMHGALATVMLSLPQEPLADQLRRKTEQFLQRRFRL